jgi:maltose O-acetyltransferase
MKRFANASILPINAGARAMVARMSENPAAGQKAKMLAGQPYMASDPELSAAHLRAQAILARFNATSADADAERRTLLTELFERIGQGTVLKPTLRCDYGFNIAIGDRTFINYDCLLLDCNRITIGDEVQIAPGVHIYTATHPIDAKARRSGIESALPVVIGDGVWLGGRAVVCPGVTIGANTVVGAGSVVTRDLPANAVAVGNPCRVIRQL